MTEEEKKVLEDCKVSLEKFRFSEITDKDNIIFKVKDVKILMNLIDKNQNQFELEFEVEELQKEIERLNNYLEFYKDLCDKQNTLLKNVCTPYGLDKVHYIFMSYTDSNGEDKRLEIRNENISDKIYKEGE